MTNPPSGSNDVFNVKRIRRLVEIMHENNLAEVDLQHGDMRIQLRSNSPQMFAVPQVAPIQAPLSPPFTPTAVSPAAATVADNSQFEFVKSPMVGTFYASPNPDTPPFVKVGDVVGHDTPVCILEAMKVFNEITAECSGKIVAILVKNGEPVEFGKPLFKVDPKG